MPHPPDAPAAAPAACLPAPISAADEAAFLSWCSASGVRAPSLLYPWAGARGRGVGARARIPPGVPFLRVPAALLLTPSALRRDAAALGAPLRALSASGRFDDDAVLAAGLAYHAAAGAASPLAPWMAVLPRAIGALDEWSPEELAELQDAALAALAEDRRAHVAATADALCAAVAAAGAAEIAALPPGSWSAARLAWALRCVASRSYGRRLREPTMVPLADALNHGSVAVRYGMLPSDDAAASGEAEFCIWPSGEQAYEAGEEVLNSYGRRSNGHLALEYGFALEANEWETVLLQPGAAGDVGRLLALRPPALVAAGGSAGGRSRAVSSSRDLLTPAKARLLLALGLAHPHATATPHAWVGPQLLPFFRVLAADDAAALALLAEHAGMRLAGERADAAAAAAAAEPPARRGGRGESAGRALHASLANSCSAQDLVAAYLRHEDGHAEAAAPEPAVATPTRPSPALRADVGGCDDDDGDAVAMRPSSLQTEADALSLLAAYLVSALDAAPTTLAEDDAASAGGAAAPRLAVALAYRRCRKRILAAQLETTRALLLLAQQARARALRRSSVSHAVNTSPKLRALQQPTSAGEAPPADVDAAGSEPADPSTVWLAQVARLAC